MTRAKAAIEQAQRAGAREYSTESLNASMAKMEMAEAASAKGNNAQATRLVEESYADAHLAQISAQSAKSAKAAADVDRSIVTLQDEASRTTTP
jgi:predicted double-glycine peptidase